MKQVTMHCMHPAPAPAPACIAGFIKLFRDAALPALPCPFPGYPCQSSLRLLSTVGNIFCLGYANCKILLIEFSNILSLPS